MDRMTVLLVEDDPLVRGLLKPALERRSFAVHEAGSLAHANAILAMTAVDVIVTDGILPDGTGVEWLQTLRARGDRTPAVFVSGHVRDFDTFLRLTQELGVASIHYKPLDPELVAAKVEEVASGLGDLPLRH